MWYSLDKKSKVNRQGVVKVHLTFSSEKNNQVASQEHRHLIRILLLHELEMSKVSQCESTIFSVFMPRAPPKLSSLKYDTLRLKTSAHVATRYCISKYFSYRVSNIHNGILN